MEHSQEEFILEKLRSTYNTIEPPKSTELLHLREGVNYLDRDTSLAILGKESLSSTNKELVVKNYGQDGYKQSFREYLIGLQIINPLRKITPCFLHTLGALRHGPTSTSIIYERINGTTLSVMLQEGLSFDAWLSLFMQVLLSLEVAQRRTGFTHYDLHAGNVVVRESDGDNYSIPLDFLSYQVCKPALVPVIIDLGTSSTVLDGRFIGAYNYTNSGIFHFVVAGHDMYKLMVSSYCNAKRSDTRREILKLFKFFDPEDPYRISGGQGGAGIARAQKEFCKDVLFSKVASYTPMMLIKYIYNLRLNLSPAITITPRRICSSLLSLNGSEDYTKALTSAQKLIELEAGYITPAYLLHVASHSVDPNVKRTVKKLKAQLNKDKKEKIEMDLATLEKGFQIKLPGQKAIDIARERLLDIPIRYRNASVKEQRFDELEEILDYQERLQPFLDMYFTVLELNLEVPYARWVSRISQSPLYKFYIANKIENDRVRRWGETLLASIFADC